MRSGAWMAAAALSLAACSAAGGDGARDLGAIGSGGADGAPGSDAGADGSGPAPSLALALPCADSAEAVYVTPGALPLPVIVGAHPTVGMGDSCAPSRDPAQLRDVALPWAASGYAVIAPDYAGFGNEGVEGYLNNRDQAHALLDGARALRKLLVAG